MLICIRPAKTIDAQKDPHLIKCSNAKSFSACSFSRSSHTKIMFRPQRRQSQSIHISIPSFGDDAKPVSNNQRYHTIQGEVSKRLQGCIKISTPGKGQGNSRMRRNPNIVRSKAPIKPQQSLLLRHLPKTIGHPAIRYLPVLPSLLLLQPRLHKIKRK